ncbi:MAG: hypothetical protein M0030_18725 [Actinomycetota bacterium]|nr:hypothetical protein [Actinomycetota bacterium]
MNTSQPADRPASYDVRVWKIEKYTGSKGDTYRVRWTVAGRRHGDQFKKKAQADSFRSKLLTYTSAGVAFDIESGLPLPVLKERQTQERATPTWYEHAIDYVDRQWDQVSAKQRASIADSLATVTPALVRSDQGGPGAAIVRRTLSTWAFNTNARNRQKPTQEQAAAIVWVRANALRVDELANTEVMEQALKALASKLDGPRPPLTRTDVSARSSMRH